MTESWGKLRIEVVDDEIIISLPGSSYSVTYFKRANSPQLLAKNKEADSMLWGIWFTEASEQVSGVQVPAQV